VNSSLLLVEPSPICREPLAKVLQMSGYRLTCVADGVDALHAIRESKPNLIVLELTLARLSGLDLLRVLRRTPGLCDLPAIILTAVVDPEALRSAAALGVKDYLLKSKCSLDELLHRIKRITENAPPCIAPLNHDFIINVPSHVTGASQPGTCLSNSPATASVAVRQEPPIPKLLTRDQVLAIVDNCGESKTLAGVVSQIIALVSSPRGEVSDLVALLKQDVVLAARVLQTANTAAYVSQKPRIATIEEAVRNVGLATIRNIALSVGVYESFPCDARDGFNLVRCWQHSVAVATILDKLAPTIEDVPPGVAHLVGLCHDLGEVVLRQCLADQYDELAVLPGGNSESCTSQMESAAFGISHSELTQRILAKLGLPSQISTPIRECAERWHSSKARPSTKLGRALVLADEYAHGLHLASSPRAAVAPVTIAEYRAATGGAAGADPIALKIDWEALRVEVICNTSLLARLSASDERALARPLFPRSTARIWYARHAAFGAFDPLEAAIRLLATVETHAGLPSEADAHRYDGLIVAVPKQDQAPMSLADAERISADGGKPLLYLAGASVTDIAPVNLRRYPIRLNRLAEFVAIVQAASPTTCNQAAAA
jgi:two-component system response regulator MtrA